MTNITNNRIGFVDFDGRQMSIHSFYVEMNGGRMQGPNSVYCHGMAVFQNLHGFGTRHGGINDAETSQLINDAGARFVLYPSVLENGFGPAGTVWETASELDFELLGQVI